MDQVRFDYSTKNIPIPPKNSYLKSLIEKVENVIKRMRWKAFFFDRKEEDSSDVVTNNSFGFKSRECPPQNNELDKFEADLLDMVHNVKFRNVNNKFQNKLNKDISKIDNSTKAFIPADKTSNFYLFIYFFFILSSTEIIKFTRKAKARGLNGLVSIIIIEDC